MEGISYFDIAQPQDKVFFVDDLFCVIRLDEVLSVFHKVDVTQSKIIHLRKSKLILFERDKHLLYSFKDGTKLNSVLKKLQSSTDKDWIKLVPKLMVEQSSEPIVLPVPKSAPKFII